MAGTAALRNRFGGTALILAFVALALALLPILGALGIAVSALATVIGGVAVFRAHTSTDENKAVAYTALVLGALMVVISLGAAASTTEPPDKDRDVPPRPIPNRLLL